MSKKNYAEDLLDHMSTSDRVDYAAKHGAAAFARLWRDAHADRFGGAPPLPAEIELDSQILRRSSFDDLGPMAQHTFIRGGGVVID